MESKIMNVFYGNDCLPYKDSERSVHYPIVGEAFMGASGTTEIRFYIDRIGDLNDTWVSVAKLPNGKQGFKVLQGTTDSELGEHYVSLSLNSFYTQYKGDVYISLQGYEGGVGVVLNEDDVYEIHGTPTIQATGSIKLAINYAPTQLPSDQYEFTDVQELLALVSSLTNSYFKVVSTSNIETYEFDPTIYEVGETIWHKQSESFFKLFDESGVLKAKRVLTARLENDNGSASLYLGGTTIDGVHIPSFTVDTYIDENGQEQVYVTVDDSTLEIGNAQGNSITFQGDSRTSNSRKIKIESNVNSENLFGGIDLTTTGEINLVAGQNKTVGIGGRGNTDIVIESSASTGRALSRVNLDCGIMSIDALGTSVGSMNGRIELYSDGGINIEDTTSGKKYNILAADGEFNIDWRDDDGDGGTYLGSMLKLYPVDDSAYVFGKRIGLDEDIKKSGKSLDLSINTSNYVLTASLKDWDGNVLSTKSVDLPLESIVTSATYYNEYTYGGTTYEKVIVITLATTDVPTIIPVGDLVDGLVTTQQLNTALNGKVSKSSGTYMVYGTNYLGQQTTLPYSANAVANTIALRGNNRTLTVGDPNTPNDATNKRYVDDKIAPLEIYNFNIGTNYSSGETAITEELAQELLDKKPQFIRVRTEGEALLYGLDSDNSSFLDGSAGYDRIDEQVVYNNGTYTLHDGRVSFSGLNGSSPKINVQINNTSVETSTNKVTSLSPSSTNTQYPSAKVVYDNLQNVREVAEGKCKTFVLSYGETVDNVKSHINTAAGAPKAYLCWANADFDTSTKTDITSEVLNGDYDSAAIINSQFNSQDDSVTIAPTTTYPNYSYLIIDYDGSYIFLLFSPISSPHFCAKGDIFLIKETQVPDRWYGGVYQGGNGIGLYKLETAKVTLTDYYAKAESLIPTTTNSYDLGSSTYTFKDLYLSGDISDGTNSVSVADVSNGLFNVINASDIVNNTLTQAQYDLITNGKSTRIVGTYMGIHNPILYPTYIGGGYNYGIAVGQTATGYQSLAPVFTMYAINPSTKSFEESPSQNCRIGLRRIASINEKAIPAYPSNTGTFVLKCVDGTLTWVQES